MTATLAALRSAVRSSIADLPAGAPVIVACSGGADSLVLAAIASWVGPRTGRGVAAVVVDHGLVSGSEGVARRAAEQCRALGVERTVVRRVDATSSPGGAGPEAAARDARRAALLEEAERLGAAAVLLGHTRDDQAETVLLGLARGSGGRSLAGMAPVSGMFRRPFLTIDRAAVRSVAAELGLEPHEDPWNSDDRFARVRVRHSVLPVLEEELGPGVAAALARTADLLREDADLLDSLAAQALESLAVEPRITELAALPTAVRTRVIRRLVVSAGAPAGDLTREHVLAVDRMVGSPRVRGPVWLPGGFVARKDCGRLCVDSASPTAPPGDAPPGDEEP